MRRRRGQMRPRQPSFRWSVASAASGLPVHCGRSRVPLAGRVASGTRGPQISTRLNDLIAPVEVAATARPGHPATSEPVRPTPAGSGPGTRGAQTIAATESVWAGAVGLAGAARGPRRVSPVRVAGTRGYAFTGDGTFGGLLANSAWPTTWWPQRVTIAFGTYKSAEF